MEPRPRIAILFRYPIHDHEDLNNIFPGVMKRLAESCEVHYLSHRSTRPHPLHQHPGLFFHELPWGLNRRRLADKWFKTLLWLALAPVLGLWCRIKRMDLVYVEESIPVLGWLLAVFSGRPTAMSGGDMFWDVVLPGQGWGRPLRKILPAWENICWRRLHGIISRTGALRDHLIQLGVPPDHIRVVTEATEAHIFYPLPRTEARAQLQYAADEFLVGHHGLVQANKALDRIIRFMQPLAAAHPHLRLVISGDGPDRPHLENMVQQEGLGGWVRFVGWLPGTQGLNLFLNACDVSLVNREGRFSDHFQVTANLLHSLSCGCTTLAARLRGIAELVDDGQNGLLFDPDNGHEFRAKLERLLTDPDLRARLGQAALHTARTRLAPETVTATWASALLDFARVKPEKNSP